MQQFISQHIWVIYLLAVWTIPWKGIALWKAAKNNHLYPIQTDVLDNSRGVLNNDQMP